MFETSILTQSPSRPQAGPISPSQLDGYPVHQHIELAAMLVHERICAATGSTQGWLACTKEYRNTIRTAIEAIVLDAPVGRS
jgi:hypothetical protein